MQKRLDAQEEVRALTGLGLTRSQAKVYFALVKLGKAKASVICNSFQGMVARQDIYRVLSELQKLRLIEKVVVRPAEFRPLPVKECFSILVQRRKSEIAELQKQANKVLQNLKKTSTKEAFADKTSQYVLIPEGEALLFRLKKAIENTQTSIDYTCPWKQFLQASFMLGECLKKAMEKNVNIKCIIDKPEDANLWPKVEAFTKKPSFHLRTISDFPSARLWIYDKKEMFISSYPKTDAIESPALWTNNPYLIEIMEKYLQIMWNQATEYKKEGQMRKQYKTTKKSKIASILQ